MHVFNNGMQSPVFMMTCHVHLSVLVPTACDEKRSFVPTGKKCKGVQRETASAVSRFSVSENTIETNWYKLQIKGKALRA